MSLVTVYFIQEGHDGPVKIGQTKGWAGHRVTAMQCGNHRRLQVLGIIENQPASAEADWHVRFAEVRLSGEWFMPTAALIDAVIKESKAPDSSWGTLSTTKLKTRDSKGFDGWISPDARKLLNSKGAR